LLQILAAGDVLAHHMLGEHLFIRYNSTMAAQAAKRQWPEVEWA
jgi:hypothetical protein